jgi:hypothetical protein
MTATGTPERIEIGDMSGPLYYWGPAASHSTAALSQAERAALSRLRARLASSEAGRRLAEGLAALQALPAGA